VQTQSAAPQQTETLMQPNPASQPIYKKNALNGRGVVRFSRGDQNGHSGQKLEIYANSTTTVKGFVSNNTNPFTSSNNECEHHHTQRTYIHAHAESVELHRLCGISSNWGFSVLSFTMIACHLE
jgi:hypothetical protein